MRPVQGRPARLRLARSLGTHEFDCKPVLVEAQIPADAPQARINEFGRIRGQSAPAGAGRPQALIDCQVVFLFNLIMQFESLQVFCDLAETRSFTKAAQINSVSQSAVSQTISALERHFKSLLIERSKKNFRLTTEGEVLYHYSKEILQTYDAIHSRMQEIKHVISGDIRVATVYSIGLYDLPPYVKHFMQSHPDVNRSEE